MSDIFLANLGEDVLVYILSFLNASDILRLSATCRRLNELKSIRVVWNNVLKYQIEAKGYPTATVPLTPLPSLIRQLVFAQNLGNRWLAGISSPRKKHYISGTSGTSVSHVRWLPGHEGHLLLAVSKSIWSSVSLWNTREIKSTKVGEWSPRGVIFNGFAVNEVEHSDATLAISVHINGALSVKILCVIADTNSTYQFQEVHSVDTHMKPITLKGDILALSDEVSQATIWNLKINTYAILQHSSENPSLQYNDCIQILLAHESVLVVRARSIHLFPYPDLQPHNPEGHAREPVEEIAQHSFGWVDGVSVAICPYLITSTTVEGQCSWRPLSILVRGESDNPWASDVHHIELFTLFPNPAYATALESVPQLATLRDVPPYLFPPQLSHHVRCTRGSLRCAQIMLGRFGTAVWVQPQERFFAGLLADVPDQWDRSGGTHESLRVAVFPGSLYPSSSRNSDSESDSARNIRDKVGCTGENEVLSKRIFVNEANNWTSFDYDEVRGKIALGSSFGGVTILEL